MGGKCLWELLVSDDAILDTFYWESVSLRRWRMLRMPVKSSAISSVSSGSNNVSVTVLQNIHHNAICDGFVIE